MKCLYCYNPDIVTGKGKLSYEDALRFLEPRRGLLDGVVLSGGESTLHRSLGDFIAKLKKKGFLVKIDTNGSSPLLLRSLIGQNLVDYVALDFKAPSYSFHSITQSKLYGRFESSLATLIQSDIPFEVRTTVHCELIDTSDMQAMVDYLQQQGYKGNYYIQPFMNDTPTLSPLGPSPVPDYSGLRLQDIKLVLRGQ